MMTQVSSKSGWRWVIRKIISWAIRFTPDVYYFAADMPASINGELARISQSKFGEATPFTTAGLAIANASAEFLEPGGEVVLDLASVSRKDKFNGSYRIVITRLEDDQ